MRRANARTDWTATDETLTRRFPGGIVAILLVVDDGWYAFLYRGGWPLGVKGATRPPLYRTERDAKAAARRAAARAVRRG